MVASGAIATVGSRISSEADTGAANKTVAAAKQCQLPTWSVPPELVEVWALAKLRWERLPLEEPSAGATRPIGLLFGGGSGGSGSAARHLAASLWKSGHNTKSWERRLWRTTVAMFSGRAPPAGWHAMAVGLLDGASAICAARLPATANGDATRMRPLLPLVSGALRRCAALLSASSDEQWIAVDGAFALLPSHQSAAQPELNVQKQDAAFVAHLEAALVLSVISMQRAAQQGRCAIVRQAALRVVALALRAAELLPSAAVSRRNSHGGGRRRSSGGRGCGFSTRGGRGRDCRRRLSAGGGDKAATASSGAPAMRGFSNLSSRGERQARRRSKAEEPAVTAAASAPFRAELEKGEEEKCSREETKDEDASRHMKGVKDSLLKASVKMEEYPEEMEAMVSALLAAAVPLCSGVSALFMHELQSRHSATGQAADGADAIVAALLLVDPLLAKPSQATPFQTGKCGSTIGLYDGTWSARLPYDLAVAWLQVDMEAHTVQLSRLVDEPVAGMTIASADVHHTNGATPRSCASSRPRRLVTWRFPVAPGVLDDLDIQLQSVEEEHRDSVTRWQEAPPEVQQSARGKQAFWEDCHKFDARLGDQCLRLQESVLQHWHFLLRSWPRDAAAASALGAAFKHWLTTAASLSLLSETHRWLLGLLYQSVDELATTQAVTVLAVILRCRCDARLRSLAASMQRHRRSSRKAQQSQDGLAQTAMAPLLLFVDSTVAQWPLEACPNLARQPIVRGVAPNIALLSLSTLLVTRCPEKLGGYYVIDPSGDTNTGHGVMGLLSDQTAVGHAPRASAVQESSASIQKTDCHLDSGQSLPGWAGHFGRPGPSSADASKMVRTPGVFLFMGHGECARRILQVDKLERVVSLTNVASRRTARNSCVSALSSPRLQSIVALMGCSSAKLLRPLAVMETAPRSGRPLPFSELPAVGPLATSAVTVVADLGAANDGQVDTAATSRDLVAGNTAVVENPELPFASAMSGSKVATAPAGQQLLRSVLTRRQSPAQRPNAPQQHMLEPQAASRGASPPSLPGPQRSEEFEAFGLPLSLMLAGAPAVVGNLWDILSGDLDVLTFAVLWSWAKIPSKGNGTFAAGGASEATRDGCRTLLEALLQARQGSHCRLPYLTGASLVCYGVPV
eukprot:TRINITY_DN57054_c0_g1_i1.p1 TRINITY_DN57054_c0_g1~~TRINITY_DN57054_c0_g1_i1.p1  ORF type:complete len:1176 (-),score=196.72 TRINITY_DN57054_c0_g1_i1:35-3454(-)